jgi:serine phosphatase RsbU (regulator of sigma subunit)/anti-sigma regulatory factor (Ser/Thr protein kinase)
MVISGRILIVDDNKSIHEDIQRILQSAVVSQDEPKFSQIETELFGKENKAEKANFVSIQYVIDNAYQGEEAVRMVEQAAKDGKNYSLVFMDVRMPPGMDGISAIEAIWKVVPDTEVVICTAHSDYSWDDILGRLGSSDHLLFLRKPLDSVAVKQTALAICRKYQIGKELEKYVRNLEQMVDERTEQLTGLVKEKEEYIRLIQEDMDLAQVVQRHILPKKLPELETVEIAAKYIPAAVIGGDFYDVIKLDRRNIAIAIMDVSGHGVAAALITAMAKFSLTQQLQIGKTPSEAFKQVNRDIFACTPAEMYITAFLLILNIENMEATFSNAGHVPALLSKRGEDKIRELTTRGWFIGAFEESNYVETKIQLQEGDRILFYTDGLIEPTNSKELRIGSEKLSKWFIEGGVSTSASMLDHILGECDGALQGATRNDDVCMVGVTIKRSEFLSVLCNILSLDTSSHGIRFSMICKEEEIDGIVGWILHTMDQNGYPDPLIKKMRIAITEILLNAIYHGNKGNPNQSVRVGYRIDANSLAIGILDEGDGFDAQAILEDENKQGIGIKIARHFVDSLKFYGNGNCVILLTNK